MRVLLGIVSGMALLAGSARAQDGLAFVPASGGAEAVSSAGSAAGIAADGRRYGHLPYPEIASQDLVPAPEGFSLQRGCLIHRDMAADLDKLLARARSELKGVALRSFSCFRSVSYQAQVFCRGGHAGQCADPLVRSRTVAPPGYSEHATGYAIDFTSRPGGCRDASPCFGDTVAGRWLLQNAPEFGFELSFPAGNGQGVSYEPWHWRWVGKRDNASDAVARARTLFEKAHERFPAFPNILGLSTADLASRGGAGGAMSYAALLRNAGMAMGLAASPPPRPLPPPSPDPLPGNEQRFPLWRLPASTEWQRPL